MFINLLFLNFVDLYRFILFLIMKIYFKFRSENVDFGGWPTLFTRWTDMFIGSCVPEEARIDPVAPTLTFHTAPQR